MTKAQKKKELLKRWHSGYKWLGDKEHDSNKLVEKLANDGGEYNHQLFLAGVRRMEQIEDDLREVGVTDKDYNTSSAVETFTKSI